MYHIIICDDDKRFINYMREIILKSGMRQEEVLFYEYLSGDKLICNLDMQKVCDLLILDMQMQGKDGNQTAIEFRKKFPVATLVFCSGECHPTDESFKVSPFRYLLKSYSKNNMIAEMQVVINEIKSRQIRPQIVGTYYYSTICLKPEEILYIENTRIGSIIHVCENTFECKDGKHITTKRKLKELSDELQPYGFERAHNSYIVNLEYVVKLQSNGEIKLKDNTILMVSRSKLKMFRKAFSEWIARKY